MGEASLSFGCLFLRLVWVCPVQHLLWSYFSSLWDGIFLRFLPSAFPVQQNISTSVRIQMFPNIVSLLELSWLSNSLPFFSSCSFPRFMNSHLVHDIQSWYSNKHLRNPMQISGVLAELLLPDWFCCSIIQSCPTLCDPMDCSSPVFPVLHHLPEFAQTHLHWVDEDIQPSHPLSSLSHPAFNLSQHQGLFQWVSSSHQVAKVLEFQLQHQSFQWIFRTNFL